MSKILDFIESLDQVAEARKALDLCVSSCEEDADYFCYREQNDLEDRIERTERLFREAVLEALKESTTT